MRIVRERKQQCATVARVELQAEAATRLPAEGTPEHIILCAIAAEGRGRDG